MLAVITGDIIDSRKLGNQQDWLVPVQGLLGGWGESPDAWEIFRGDSFQFVETDPLDALRKAMLIKATLKSIKSGASQSRNALTDVRLSIGIGNKGQGNGPVGMRSGEAFFNSGEAFEALRMKKQNMVIKSPWRNFDREMNLMLKLALIVMDNWSVNSGEIMKIILERPSLKQSEIGELLGIEQNSVSGRFKRAYQEEIMELEEMYRLKLKTFLLG